MDEHDRHVLRAARETVRIQRDGKSLEITREEALIYKNHDLAFKGSVHAVRNASAQIAKAASVEAAEIAQTCLLWGNIKERQIRALKRAAQSGAVAPRLLPHPADILIHHRTGVRIVGPIDEEEWAAFDHRVKLRDTLYIQHAMEEFDTVYPDRGPEPLSTPLIFAMLQNTRLPPSLKLSTEGEGARLRTLRRMTRREALKACHMAWRMIGKDMPRGKRLMPAEVMLPLFGVLMELAKDLTAAGNSQHALNEAIDQTTRRLAREVPWPKRQSQTAAPTNLESIRHDAI